MAHWETMTKSRIRAMYPDEERPWWVSLVIELLSEGFIVARARSTKSESVYLSVSNGVADCVVRWSGHRNDKAAKDFDFPLQPRVGPEQAAGMVRRFLREHSHGQEPRSDYKRRHRRRRYSA